MNFLHESWQPGAERLGWALLHSLWQGAAIAVLLALALALLRRRSAAARYAACLLALVALFGAAFVTALRVEPREVKLAAGAPIQAPVAVPAGLAAPAEPPTVAPVAGPKVDGAALPSAQISAAAAAPTRTAIPWSDRLQPWLPGIATIWLVGVCLLSVRQIYGWRRIRQWRRAGEEVRGEAERAFARLAERFGLRGRVWLRQSADAIAPMLTGVLRPIILLPARLLTGLTAREVEAILAHELAHLARRDTWTNLAQVCIETVLFYHPAVWWIARRARTEREHAADDLALRYCGDRREYAGALARLAELQCAPAFVLAATGGSLLARIRRIVLPPAREPATAAWTLPALATICIACAAFIFTTHAQAPKPIVVRAGESLQAAIDAAPAGAVLKLEAGEWKERIVISKPLTIEGAGWEKTILAPDKHDPAAAERSAIYNKRFEGVTEPAERRKLVAEGDPTYEPTVLVRDTEKVVVKGLKILGKHFEDREFLALYRDPLVLLMAGKATFLDCVLAGYYTGARVSMGSELEMRRCLVAGMGNSGIAVPSGGRLVLIDSEVRSCYYSAIGFSTGGADSRIERCRFSGTAWHGIRYDDASPTITGCRFDAIERCGVYASGKTKAVVQGNLFHGAGIWCLLGSEDRVEGNTFIGNTNGAFVGNTTGVASSAGAKIHAVRNLIVGAESGVALTKTSGQDPLSQALGEARLEANWFWNNKTNLTAGMEPRALPAGNGEGDPKFVAAGQGDFSLAADSPARAAGAGVAAPLDAKSPWPLLAEEKAIVPEGETRDSRYWKSGKASVPTKQNEVLQQKASVDAKSWVADAFQLDDRAKREAAIESVRQAMTSGNAEQARAGITAFTQLGPVEFDKPSFRPAVRALLASGDASTRAKAASAITMTGADAEDLARIFALADDPAAEVRNGLTYVIVSLMKYDLTGKDATVAILKLMDQMPKDARNIGHALWGARFSPEIEGRVLEYCKDVDSQIGYSFFYGSLSTQGNKSEASCKRLIEILAHPDTTNKAGRAAWGLQQGVAKAQYPLVADAMLRVAEARSDGNLRSNALRCLETYAGPAQADGLKALLAKPGVTGDFRQKLESILQAVTAAR